MEEAHEAEPGRDIYISVSVACHVQGNSDFVQNNSGIKIVCPAEEMYVGNWLLAGGVGSPDVSGWLILMV